MYLEKAALDYFRRYAVSLPRPSKMHGEKASRVLGQNLEFEQFSPYTPGDNLRDIDWKAFARSGKLFVKNYGSDLNADTRIVIDISASMNYEKKRITALKTAACLTALLLASKNPVTLASVGEEYREHGRVSIKNLEQKLENLPQSKETDLSLIPPARRENLFLISDLWQSNLDFESLTQKGAHLIHLLSPAEERFELTGNLSLTDSESAQRLSVIPAEVRELYREKMNRRTESIRKACRKNRVFTQMILTDELYYVRLKEFFDQMKGGRL